MGLPVSNRPKKSQQLAPKESQPWTTTRCHRLLRPLKTHLAALKKQVESESSETLMSDGGSLDGSSGESKSKHKIHHTYSKRRRRPTPVATAPAPRCADGVSKTPEVSKFTKPTKKNNIQPGEIALPTPIIRRARGCQLSSPVQQPPLKAPGAPSSSYLLALELDLDMARSRLSAVKFSLHESILRAFLSLLLATKEPLPRAKASKSLMAMCLRKIPEYIGELEEWERQQAEEEGTKSTLHNSEMSNEVYEAVEAAVPHGSGCPQLRTLARAHAMKAVSDAIKEGFLDDIYSIALIRLCSNTNALYEAEGMLAVLLDRSYPKPRGVDSTFDEVRRLSPLKALRDFAHESHRPQFMLRQLSKLIAHQKLPLHWLSTKEFSDIWSGVVKALSGDGVCDDTVSFAAHMITSLSFQAKGTAFSLRPHKDDIERLSQHTLLSAVSTVASLSLLHQEAGRLPLHDTRQPHTSPVFAKVGYIMQTCIYEMKRTRKPRWMKTSLKLAAYLASSSQDNNTKVTDINDVWNHVTQYQNKKDGKQQYEAATVIIASLAQLCGRGTLEPSHHYLVRLCSRLAQAVDDDEATARKFQADCAFVLSERTNDLRDLAFAESFNTATAALGQTIQPTPRRTTTSSSFKGFRWDEGISEWVTATPAIQLAPRQSSRRNAYRLGSNDESRASSGESHGNSDGGVSDAEDSGKDTAAVRSVKSRRSLLSAQSSREGSSSSAKITTTTARKRGSGAAVGRLALWGESEDDDSDEDDPLDDDDDNVVAVHRLDRHATKRRRVSATTNASTATGDTRRGLLRTMPTTVHGDESEDELGL